MKKQNSVFMLLIVVILMILMFAEYAQPKRINWNPTYASSDQNPYGAYILHQELAEVFPAQKIETKERTIYESLKRDFKARTHLAQGDVNYLFINRLFDPNPTDFRILKKFVNNGGEAFISARLFNKAVADELEIKTSYFFLNTKDSVSLKLTPPHPFANQTYYFKPGTVTEYFEKYNKTKSKVLAVNSRNQPILIKYPHGDGHFYINTTPLAFANYHMVFNNNAHFVAGILSYLPRQTVFWDEYYKEGRIHDNNRLRFVFSRESLRWAFWLTAVGLLLFIIFDGRRKQRVIPIIKPLPNTTLDFTKTVGQLYYQRRNHKNIAEKRITHFLEFVRTHLYLSTAQFDDDFLNKLAAKTNGDRREIATLFKLIKQVKAKSVISDTQLLYLSSHIDRVKAAYEGKDLSKVEETKASKQFNNHIIFGIFWLLMGSAAALSYIMTSGGDMLYLFLGVVVLGIVQIAFGTSQQAKERSNRIRLSRGKKPLKQHSL
ncbi:DUF4350 domain-containing protein [uncultured Microscilla sp.]|uniref:DUF4350 domain-containing protein n=1 Tax=uncultured Microscilla sp. TaxID=432653 RepID=UPI0026282FF5|nr:DUF4350 domain-containing protein [uncultured Microscilla sp.]